MDVFDSPLTLVHFRFWCKLASPQTSFGVRLSRILPKVKTWRNKSKAYCTAMRMFIFLLSCKKKNLTVWKAMVKGAALTHSIIADCKHISIRLHQPPFVMCDWPLDRRITDSLQRHQLLPEHSQSSNLVWFSRDLITAIRPVSGKFLCHQNYFKFALRLWR